MPPVGNLDDEARAELLCYLVASQLRARSITGEWLLTKHRNESALIWLGANGGNCGWNERAELCEMSTGIAARVHAIGLVTDAELVTLFTEGWRLDYRNPATRTLHDICAAQLRDAPSGRGVAL